MRLIDLYNRVVETIGMEIMTPESVCVAAANCFGDMSSRGYRMFKEQELTNLSTKGRMVIASAPKNIRKTLYCKVLFNRGLCQASRISIANPSLGSVYDSSTGVLRTPVTDGAVFYIKDGKLIVEWSDLYDTPQKIILGYYAKLVAPPIVDTPEKLENIVLDIRPEFEDALVFYSCWFFYTKNSVKDEEKLALYYGQYKYYMEDILQELAHEDMYNEEDAVIRMDG